MTLFVGWIKEGEEHQRAFENSRVMQTGKVTLRGNWNVIRKARFVRLIRRMIEEGIIVKGVEEMYEEGCRILSEMERGREGREEEEECEEEEEEEVERYMCELYLLRVRGEQKKMKESEVAVLNKQVEDLRRKVEEETRRREEEKRRANEAERRAEEEKKKREETERRLGEVNKRVVEEKKGREEEKRGFEERIARMEKEMEEMKKKEGILHTATPSNSPPITPTASSVITSLDGTSVVFPYSNGIKREGNTINHHGPNSFRNCIIGAEMTSV